MKNMKKIIVAIFVAISFSSYGQITEVLKKDLGPEAIWYFQFVQLEKLGTCYLYLNPNDTSAIIYDMNFNVLQKTHLPDIEKSYAIYVSQNLFDLDDGVEMMIVNDDWNSTSDFYVKIVDDNGTLIEDFKGYYPIVDPATDHFSAIRTVGDKTYMTLMNMVDATFRVFTLPGKFQSCCNCTGVNTSTTKSYTVSSSSLKSYPNPVSKSVTVEYSLPLTIDNANLVLINSVGAQIAFYPVKEDESELTIDASGLTPGIYFWFLTKTDGTVITSKQIIKVY